MDFSMSELWAQTGLFAKAIVIAMLVMSLVSVVITCERLVVFIRSRNASRRYAERMVKALGTGELESASKTDDVGHVGRVIEAGLTAYKTCPVEDEDFTVETVARALERQSQREIQTLKRGQGLLATISSTAPFVGLLGTVMGIVTAFEKMAESGQGGLATVSAGVAEALVTTAMGLFVAIPAVFAFNFLQGWVDARAVDIAESSNEFLDYLARRLRENSLRANASHAE
jgi:biopolymer transport protein ExbB/biopolymer transport protein TolQ